MGAAQSNTRISDAVYSAGDVLDATLLYAQDGVIVLTEDTIERHGLTEGARSYERRLRLPQGVRITAGRLIRLGTVDATRLTAFLGAEDGTIRIFNPALGNLVAKYAGAETNSTPGTGHSGAVTCVEHVECERIISGGRDGTVRMWDLNAGKQERVFKRDDTEIPVDVLAIAYMSDTPQGPAIAAAYSDGQLRVFSCTDNNDTVRTLLMPGERPSHISYLSESKLLVASSEAQIAVWDLNFHHDLPEATAAVSVSIMQALPARSLKGPWPDTPIILAGMRDGSFRAFALVSLPEFSRCEVVPLHQAMPAFTEAPTIINAVARTSTLLGAAGNTVRIISQQVMGGGISGPVVTGESDEETIPVPCNPRVEEWSRYLMNHPDEVINLLHNLQEVSSGLREGKSPSDIEGTIEDPHAPEKLLEEKCHMLGEVFAKYQLPPPESQMPDERLTDSERLLHELAEQAVKTAMEKNAKLTHKTTSPTGITLGHDLGITAGGAVPIVDASAVWRSSLQHESLMSVSEAAEGLVFRNPPRENLEHPAIMRLQGQQMYRDIEALGRHMKSIDSQFERQVNQLSPPVGEGKTDLIDALLDVNAGVRHLQERRDETVAALKDMQEEELKRFNELKEGEIERVKQRFDGERRFWAARFGLALMLHQRLRMGAADECARSMYNAILKSLPSGTVGGDRYVTLPLFANPDDPNDRTESKEDPSNLLYPAYDLEERCEVAARSIPTGAFDERRALTMKHKYLIQCITLAPSVSDAHMQYVVTVKPPRMNLLKALNDPHRPLPAFPLPAAARLTYKILLTLGYLMGDKKNLVHRDLRPSNIMLRNRGGSEVQLRARRRHHVQAPTSASQETEETPNAASPVQEEQQQTVETPEQQAQTGAVSESTYGGVHTTDEDEAKPATAVKLKMLEPVLFHVGFMRSTMLNEPVELGTVFAAPEVCYGSVSRYIDVWSIGLLLIKLLLPPPCATKSREAPSRQSPVFMPYIPGMSPEYATRWDLAKPWDVRNSLLMQMANFASDCPPCGQFSMGEAREFAKQARIGIETEAYAKLMHLLTGRVIDVMEESRIASMNESGGASHSFVSSVEPPLINPYLKNMLPDADDSTLALVTSCLSFYPRNRPSLEVILGHKWFEENGIKIDHEAILRLKNVDERITREGYVIGERMDYGQALGLDTGTPLY